MAKEDLILESIMEVKQLQGEHTQAIKSVQGELTEWKAQCPVQVKRIDDLEQSKTWFKGAVAALWLVFIIVTTILAIYLG